MSQQDKNRLLNDTALTLLFKYLEKTHVSTLRDCLLVSKKWYELAKPLFWTVPKFTMRRGCESFLRIVEVNKELASLVTSLDLTEYKRDVVIRLLHSLDYLDSLNSLRTSSEMGVPIEAITTDKILQNMLNIKELEYLEVQLESESISNLVILLNSVKEIETLGIVLRITNEGDLSSIHLLESLQKMDSLRKFSLVGEHIPEEVIRLFIKRMPNMESLTIKSLIKTNIIYSLRNILPRTIKHLELGKIAESSELVTEFFENKDFCRLRKLHLELDKSCVLSPEQVINLLNAQSDPLEEILVSGIDFRREFVTEELRKHPTLRRVTFRRLASYDPPPIKFWEVVLKCFGENLTHLHIEDGMLPENLGDLIGTHCTNLVDFSARNTTMDTRSVTQLVKKAGNHIRVLNLSQTEIGEYGINSVLTFCKAVEDLNLSEIYGSPYLDPMVFAGVFLRRQGGRLRQLRVNGLPINNMLFQMLAKTSTKCLEILSFTENQCISDPDLENLMERCHRLKLIHVSANPDGHEGLSRDLIHVIENRFIYSN